MSKPKLFSTHILFEGPRKKLEEHFEVDFWKGEERPSHQEFLKRVAGMDALVCLLTEKIDDEMLDAAGPRLRIVANVAVGYDNIDVPACTKRNVAVTNTPGVLDETTADFTWTLLMAVARRLVEADHMARSGEWKKWNLDQLCGTDIWGKTLGIIGFGRIGRAVARRASGFRMRVIYHSTSRAPLEMEKELNAEFMSRDEVFEQADFVSLHVPLNAATRGLAGPAEFARMKPTAFFVNTTRGPVVQETALIDALENGLIAGAALDVFEREPIIPDGLRRNNVVLAPHLGSASIETRTKMAMIAAENAIAMFEGQRPPTILNPEVLHKS
ncbi:MAG TPA: D-glycerate dehydrogenase [Candidatus Saccharimonadales bacterium]|nr:D-glycerate dehydrogenase [Candidatus Saccharimonadales bacterium]